MPKKAWRESLRPRIEAARRELVACDAADVARRAGLAVRNGRLDLTLLDSSYSIGWPDLSITFRDGTDCPEELVLLVLDYLVRADGSVPTGEWIGFQELPNFGIIVYFHNRIPFTIFSSPYFPRCLIP